MIHKQIQVDNYCCKGFKSYIDNKNKKGFSIECEEDSYYLTFRSNNQEDEDLVISILREKLIGVKMPSSSFQGRVKLNFCFVCGNEL